MGWWFGRKSAPADARPFVPAWLRSDAAEEGFARSYSEQFEEIYRRNPVGQRAVRLVAGMLGGLTIDAIEGPSTSSGQASRAAALIQADGLLENIAANLLLHGNAYVQLITDDRDAPAELCLLRPERVSVVSDEKGWPVAYLYRAAGRAVRIERKDALERQQLVHLKALNPRDDHYGMHHRRLRRDRGVDGSMKAFPKLAADPGRIVANRDVPVSELKLALFEVPQESRRSDAPTVLLAASMISGWRRECVEVRHAGKTQIVQTAPSKSVLGHVATALDESNADKTIEVVLHDPEQWLTSCSDHDLEVGQNLAAIGDEVVQFGEATALGAGRFRLGRLLRGRAGTTSTARSKAEPFVLLKQGALQPIMLPVWKRGSPVLASAQDGAIQCSLIPALKGFAPEGVRLIF